MDDSDLQKILNELKQQTEALNFIAKFVAVVEGLALTVALLAAVEFLRRQFHWF